MKGRAIYIPVDGPIVIKTTKPAFKAVQQYVEGYVEAVTIHVDPAVAALMGIPCSKPARMQALCNEEGQLHDLPINIRATMIMGLDQYISGNVVLFDGYSV